MSALRWFGRAGHFIAADCCRFHLHTHVGRYCVSTVGDYWPPHERERKEPEQIGYGRLYETMVFALGPDDAPISWTEIEMRPYMTAEEADVGHMEMVEKWRAL